MSTERGAGSTRHAPPDAPGTGTTRDAAIDAAGGVSIASPRPNP